MQYCKTVTLRTRPIKNGTLSYYLDFYPGYRDKVTMKTTRHESLGIYIYADPKNKREKEFNEIMTEKAEAIRCRRFESVVNERYDFFDHSKMSGDFLAYFKRVLKNKDPKWKFVYGAFQVLRRLSFTKVARVPAFVFIWIRTYSNISLQIIYSSEGNTLQLSLINFVMVSFLKSPLGCISSVPSFSTITLSPPL